VSDWDDEEYEKYYAQQGQSEPQYQQQQAYPPPNAPPGAPHQPYAPQDYTQASEYQQSYRAYPNGRVPPKSNKKWLWIGIISGIVIIVVILAALFIIPYFTQSPIVGTWHITKQSIYFSNGTLAYNGTDDEYMVFNASGTGYDYKIDTYSEPYSFNFTWKDLGNNKIELNPEKSSYSLKMDYHISGDSISLSMYMQGKRLELSGERINGIPANAEKEIGSWKVYIDGQYTNEIVATTQPDGSATWSGEIKIIVYDQGGNPLPNAQVDLEGAGIYMSDETDSNGIVNFYVYDVTLPSGVSTNEITVTISYHSQEKTLGIIVTRG